MRYSIINSTLEQVKAVGGADTKEAKHSKIIFAELDNNQAAQLKQKGASVKSLSKVTTSDTILLEVPKKIPASPLYSADFVVKVATFDNWRDRYSPQLLGKGMVVAVVGTGIRETHEAINGHVIYSENFTSDPMTDAYDHETAVASCLLAQAPECSILNLKVLDSNGEGTTEQVVLAIEKCLELWDENSSLTPKLINLSLGTPDMGDPDEPLRVACRAALERGMYVNAAAGNAGPRPGTILSPACEQYVFATGCCDLVTMNTNKYGFQVSDFSSRGPTLEGIVKPDAVFFGRDLEIASSKSDTALIAKSGTSFATPFTSGIAILYMEQVVRQVPNWQELQAGNFPHIPPEEMPTEDILIPLSEVIDVYLRYLCINPGGAGTAKTNDYGEGMPFGDQITKSITPVTDPLAGVIQTVMPIMTLAMVSIIIIPMSKAFK